MIFTLPHQLHGLARCNKWAIYSLILRSSWETVRVLSEKEENIGALAGMVSVLHTFGSDMKYHIHTHNLVTFGGLDPKTNKWKRPKRKDRIAGYRAINKTYRELFLEGLEKLYSEGKISYHKTYEEIELEVKSINWVVHNTKPTIDTRILEDYLARYINRIAVSNSKVEWLKDQAKVKLTYNDYRNQKDGEAAPKGYKLINPLVFIDQFLQHVLPPYFQKTRRYGLHSSASKKKYKALIANDLKRDGEVVRTVIQIVSVLLNSTPYICEKCESEFFEIILVRPEKEWLDQYMKVPKHRPPR